MLAITIFYLGPTSHMFLQRQTKSHMSGLDFNHLSSEHLPELSKWIKISAGLLIDKDKAQELAEKVLLAKP